VRAAALIVRVGLDHEPWFARLKVPKEVPVLDASRSVKLLQTQLPRLRAERHAHTHAWGNTHYWLDPANAIAITADIGDALARLSPRDAPAFEANRRAFTQGLDRRIRDWQAARRRFPAPGSS
jgi:ABC-type Zn uptake system ZnuABC Zn-binding protein ZnuA